MRGAQLGPARKCALKYVHTDVLIFPCCKTGAHENTPDHDVAKNFFRPYDGVVEGIAPEYHRKCKPHDGEHYDAAHN